MVANEGHITHEPPEETASKTKPKSRNRSGKRGRGAAAISVDDDGGVGAGLGSGGLGRGPAGALGSTSCKPDHLDTGNGESAFSTVLRLRLRGGFMTPPRYT